MGPEITRDTGLKLAQKRIAELEVKLAHFDHLPADATEQMAKVVRENAHLREYHGIMHSLQRKIAELQGKVHDLEAELEEVQSLG